MPKTIGNMMRKARMEKDLTREDLSKKLKISTSYVGLIETDGPVPVSERVADALKKTLGISISEYQRNQTKKRTINYRATLAKLNAKAKANKRPKARP